MPPIRPMQSPLLGGPTNPFRRVVMPTDEQRQEALDLTRASATKIRNLCRELDLPGEAFGVVAQLYLNLEWGVVQRGEDERETKENALRLELVGKLRDKGVVVEDNVAEYVEMMGGLNNGGRNRRRNDGLDFLDNEEIRALAKKYGIE